MHPSSNWLQALVLAGATLTGAGVAAQEVPRLVAKKTPTPVDRLLPASNVSVSRQIVGVMYGTSQTSPKATLKVGISEDWEEGASLCARLLSADGLYEGIAEYDVTKESLGHLTALDVVISAENWEEVSHLENDGLGVAVTRGRCDGPAQDHVAALWRNDPDPSADLRLLVNSQGATAVSVVAVKEDGTSGNTVCERIEDGAGVAFDHVCRIAAADLGPGKNLVRLNRMTRGAFEDPVEIVVEVPDTAR